MWRHWTSEAFAKHKSHCARFSTVKVTMGDYCGGTGKFCRVKTWGGLKESACSAKPPSMNKVKDKNQITAATKFTLCWCGRVYKSVAVSGFVPDQIRSSTGFTNGKCSLLTSVWLEFPHQNFSYQIIKDLCSCFDFAGLIYKMHLRPCKLAFRYFSTKSNSHD